MNPWKTRVCAGLALPLVLCGCSSSSSGTSAGGVPVASCSTPGEATPGPADSHCAGQGPDGGPLVQAVTLACNATPPAEGDDGGCGESACPFGATTFGHEADDDDCKYHVKWSSTPVCETPGGVSFTLVVTRKTDSSPVTDAGVVTEVFTTTPGDEDAATYCDDMSMHGSPTVKLTEGPPGTYVGPVQFDRPGAWTVRFHFFETCIDAPNAPHGHVAFHLTVP